MLMMIVVMAIIIAPAVLSFKGQKGEIMFKFNNFLKEENAAGVVEMILIIVEIFTGIQSVDNVNKGGIRGKRITQYTVDK